MLAVMVTIYVGADSQTAVHPIRNQRQVRSLRTVHAIYQGALHAERIAWPKPPLQAVPMRPSGARPPSGSHADCGGRLPMAAGRQLNTFLAKSPQFGGNYCGCRNRRRSWCRHPVAAVPTEIKVGNGTMISYFLYPLLRGLDDAIREPNWGSQARCGARGTCTRAGGWGWPLCPKWRSQHGMHIDCHPSAGSHLPRAGLAPLRGSASAGWVELPL